MSTTQNPYLWQPDDLVWDDENPTEGEKVLVAWHGTPVKYSPEQARDERGRFGPGQGEGGADVTSRLSSNVQQQQAAWNASLTQTERDALTAYANGLSGKWPIAYRLNASLREGGVLSEPLATQMAAIDSALAKASAPFDMTVYRGVGYGLGETLQASVGKTFTDPAFLSCSLDEQYPLHSVGAGSGVVGSVICQIAVPQGSPGAYIGGFGYSDASAKEFLLARGGSLRVLSFTTDRSGQQRASLAYAPPTENKGRFPATEHHAASPAEDPLSRFTWQPGDIVWNGQDGAAQGKASAFRLFMREVP